MTNNSVCFRHINKDVVRPCVNRPGYSWIEVDGGRAQVPNSSFSNVDEYGFVDVTLPEDAKIHITDMYNGHLQADVEARQFYDAYYNSFYYQQMYELEIEKQSMERLVVEPGDVYEGTRLLTPTSARVVEGRTFDEVHKQLEKFKEESKEVKADVVRHETLGSDVGFVSPEDMEKLGVKPGDVYQGARLLTPDADNMDAFEELEEKPPENVVDMDALQKKQEELQEEARRKGLSTQQNPNEYNNQNGNYEEEEEIFL